MNKLSAMRIVIDCLEIFLQEPREVALRELASMMNVTESAMLTVVEVLEKKGYMTIDTDHSMIRPGYKTNYGPLVQQGGQKGVNETTLLKIKETIKKIPDDLDFSSSEFAALSGLSRVTARRYLEFLVTNGTLSKGNKHGEVGRPVNKYRVIRKQATHA